MVDCQMLSTNRAHALTVGLNCRCVSSSILEMASSDASPDQPQANAQQHTVRAFLSSLSGQLCAGQGSFSQTGLLQQPWVLATAARLIGDYAMWFSQLGGPEAPLEGALRLLLQAMLRPQVRMSQSRLSVTHGNHMPCLLGFTAPNTPLCWYVLRVWECWAQTQSLIQQMSVRHSPCLVPSFVTSTADL